MGVFEEVVEPRTEEGAEAKDGHASANDAERIGFFQELPRRGGPLQEEYSTEGYARELANNRGAQFQVGKGEGAKEECRRRKEEHEGYEALKGGKAANRGWEGCGELLRPNN